MRLHAIDIGGSSVKQAIVATSPQGPRIERGLETIRLDSRRFALLEAAVMAAVEAARAAESGLDGVAICTTGSVTPEGIVLNAGHFEDYANISWAALLRAPAKLGAGQIAAVQIAAAQIRLNQRAGPQINAAGMVAPKQHPLDPPFQQGLHRFERGHQRPLARPG